MSYIKNNWKSGDKVTSEKLNNIENGIKGNEKKIENLNFQYNKYGLPILYINGDISKMTKDDKVTLNYVYGDKTGTCTMKWQGSSSLAYPKKNYTIVFDNAFEAVEGWGKQNKYCLKANYIDFSHSRNICSANIWSNLVKYRRANVLPETVFNKSEAITGNKILNDETILNNLANTPNNGAIAGFPILLIINEKYVGLYTLNIPKEGWLFGMDGATVNGAFVCAEGGDVSGACSFKTSDNIFSNSGFELEYNSETLTEEMLENSLKTLINTCIAINEGTEDISALDPYIDWPSVIDYMLYALSAGHLDGLIKNYILATYDGVKWFMSAYDMDSTFGLNWDGKSFVGANTSTNINSLKQQNILFKIILEDDNKKAILKRRYNEMTTWAQTLPLAQDFITNTFITFISQIHHSIYLKESELWEGIPCTSINNVSQILQWYNTRINYITNLINSL